VETQSGSPLIIIEDNETINDTIKTDLNYKQNKYIQFEIML